MMRIHDFPVMKKRLIQFFRIGQISYALVVLVLLVKFINSGEPWGFSPEIIKHATILAFPELVIFLVKRNKVLFAVNLFLVVRVVAMLFIILEQGGLYSGTISILPWLLFLATVYTKRVIHLVYSCVFVVLIVGLGLNDIHQWIYADKVQLVDEKVKLAQLVIIYLASGFLSWTIASDLRFVYLEKSKEHERLLAAKEQVQTLADTDQLTGTLNRYGARRKFELFQKDTDFVREAGLLLFVDVDDFKSINDQHGHPVGDQLLREMGSRLSEIAGDSAVVSRLGGDEFVVVMKHAAMLDTRNLIDGFLSEMSKSYRIEGKHIDVTCSIGGAKVASTEQSFDELCSMADMAMYRVKMDGKNHFHYYHDDLRQQYMTNLNILQGMENALKNNALTLNYQTKFDTNSSQVVGVEALLRWTRDNPKGYTVEQIIPVIETTSLIHEIGNWVLRAACQECKAWHEKGSELPVSVNIASRQLTHQNFAKNVETILQETGLAASSLVLEITENALIHEGTEVMAQLREVKALGVKLAIDGFGAGYSNMTYLAELQVDELKMDRSFVSTISSEKTQLVVAAFISMAHKLGVQFVAQGIETEKEREMLNGLGCKVGQGFLQAEPVTAYEMSCLVR